MYALMSWAAGDFEVERKANGSIWDDSMSEEQLTIHVRFRGIYAHLRGSRPGDANEPLTTHRQQVEVIG